MVFGTQDLSHPELSKCPQTLDSSAGTGGPKYWCQTRPPPTNLPGDFLNKATLPLLGASNLTLWPHPSPNLPSLGGKKEGEMVVVRDSGAAPHRLLALSGLQPQTHTPAWQQVSGQFHHGIGLDTPHTPGPHQEQTLDSH